MYNRTQSSTLNQTDLMMTIAATLADLTETLELCQRIPAYLSRTLNLEPLTLAILRESPANGDSSLFLFCTSSTIAPDASDLFRRNMLGIGQASADVSSAPALAISESVERGAQEDDLQLKDHSRTTHFTQRIDGEFRMILALHQRDESPNLSAEIYDQLELISRQLARLLSCLVAWHTRPAVIGEEFKSITPREWAVLRELESDLGEKQLADNLKLSPHTLHAHVKSIYRRLGVQGRLSVIKRVEDSRRSWRMKLINEGNKMNIPASRQFTPEPALAG